MISLNDIIQDNETRGELRLRLSVRALLRALILIGQLPRSRTRSELLAAYLAFPSADPAAWALIEPLYLSPGIRWVAASDRDFDSLRALARGVKHLDLIP